MSGPFSVQITVVPDMDAPENRGKDSRLLGATWVIGSFEDFERATGEAGELVSLCEDLGFAPELLDA